MTLMRSPLAERLTQCCEHGSPRGLLTDGAPGALRRLAIVVPAHNEEGNVEPLVERIFAAMRQRPDWRTSVLFVDDGSHDATLARIRSLHERGYAVGYVRLTRSFGQGAALQAGLEQAQGDVVVTMDADLQHPPEELPRMLAAFEAGSDVVQMVRAHRAPGLKGVLSNLFYRVFSACVPVTLVPGASEFRLMSRRVVDELNRLPEQQKFLRALVPSLGFPQVHLSFEEGKREQGEPAHTLRSSLQLASRALFDFSTLPLRFVFWMGATLAGASFLTGLGHVAVKLIWWNEITPGFTDLITAVLFLSGCILAAVGILGHYMVMVLEQVRGRPAYVIAERSQGAHQAAPESAWLCPDATYDARAH